MKAYILLILILFSVQATAACRCSCDPRDFKLCASSYDLDHPCEGICPNQAPSIAPTMTACPPTQVYNPVTHTNEWRVICVD